jgi:hypothetical protein
MRSILKNRKGNLGATNPLGLVIGLVSGIALLVFVYFAFLYGITTLNPSGFFTANSAQANSTNNMINNLTSGGDQFASYIPTAFKIVAIVMIMGFLGLMIAAIYLFMRYGRQ